MESNPFLLQDVPDLNHQNLLHDQGIRHRELIRNQQLNSWKKKVELLVVHYLDLGMKIKKFKLVEECLV